jgi:hypothetical protein
LVSFHRSAKAPHAPPYPARCTVGLDRSLAINRGRTTDVQDKASCGIGDMCLLTGQVGGLAATATQSGEGHSQAHFTLFQSYLSNTSPLSAALKRGLCRPIFTTLRPAISAGRSAWRGADAHGPTLVAESPPLPRRLWVVIAKGKCAVRSNAIRGNRVVVPRSLIANRAGGGGRGAGPPQVEADGGCRRCPDEAK